ncbi:MAG: hypothetical protein ACOYL1_05240 [Chlamydiia bacterium]
MKRYLFFVSGAVIGLIPFGWQLWKPEVQTPPVQEIKREITVEERAIAQCVHGVLECFSPTYHFDSVIEGVQDLFAKRYPIMPDNELFAIYSELGTKESDWICEEDHYNEGAPLRCRLCGKGPKRNP